jgi:hypothetical protein
MLYPYIEIALKILDLETLGRFLRETEECKQIEAGADDGTNTLTSSSRLGVLRTNT